MLQQPSIADRIGGKRIRTGANRPFLLDDPSRVFHVEQGHLNLFGAEIVGNEVASRSPFVARIGAGETVFGAAVRPPRREGESGSGLVAVPSQDAVLIEGRLEVLASPRGFDLDTLIWIDTWIYRLSEFLIRGPGPPPRNAALLEAEPAVAYPNGSAVSAHHSDIVWVTVDQPTRFTGREDLEIPAHTMQPLSERTWLALDSDSRVTAVQTPSAYIHKQLWPALRAHNRLVLEVVAKTRDEHADAAKNRYRISGRIQEEARTRSFLELGSVLGAEEPVRARPAESRTGLRAALQIVAESLDAGFELPPGLTESADPLEAIPQLAQAGGLRARRIRLAPGWWKRDGPSFVGLDGNRSPVAVLAGDVGGFRVVDPKTRESAPVGAEAAAGIFGFGFMLYPSLPRRIRGGMDALRLTLRRRRRDLGVVLAMALLGALTALVTPILTGRLLAEVIPRVDTSLWIAMLAALLVAAFGSAVFEVVRALAMLRVEGRADEQLQAAVWSRLLSLPVPFFRRFTAGDLADRANGVSLIRQLMTGATTAAVISGIFSVFSLALLFYYSWKLALVALGFVAVLGASSYFLTRRQMEHLRVAFTEQGRIDGMVFQLISGLSKLRLAGAEGFALARWAERFAGQKRETLAARRWAAVQAVVNSSFKPLATLGLFAYIWYSIIEDNAQPGFDLAAFLSFNAAFGQFAGAATGLTGAVSAVASAVPLFERVRPILEASPERPDGGAHLRHLVGDIEFSQVSFRYLPDAQNALDRVSFRISAGDHVAFVGPSGSGKSTVYRILLGFEQPDSGSVFFDGHDLLTLDLSSLRSRMGVVMQDGQLVAASIFKNISSSAPLTMDEAWEAARLAGIADDIRAMPMGMHTVLSEGVPALSGGQKQRLLIARAFARKPRILLFDEATSALDNRTQEIVQESLARLNSTRIVIAHRLSTVQAVDRIHVLEGGRIVESGKYQELMARDGAFRRLARRQLVADEPRSR